MSINRTLTAALAALANPAHRDFLLGLYSSGGQAVLTPDNARHILPLSQYRILVAHGRDRYSLSRLLTHFFDDVTQRQRLNESLGDIADQHRSRVQELYHEYRHAVMNGNHRDIGKFADQFHGACADLAQTISSGIERLLAHIENNFAIVSSLSAKQRQNEYYLQQANKLNETLITLFRIDLIDYPLEYPELYNAYQAFLLDRRSEWTNEILRVISRLKTHLFRLRDAEPNLRRLRKLAGFLRQHPIYEFPEIANYSDPPHWLHHDPGRESVAYSDVTDGATTDDLEVIARQIPARRIISPSVRCAGTLKRRAGSAPAELMAIPRYRKALQQFAHAVEKSPSPLSAIDWKLENSAAVELTDPLWLMLVLHGSTITTSPFPSLRLEPIGRRGTASISRNLYLTDIVVDGPTAYPGIAALRSVP